MRTTYKRCDISKSRITHKLKYTSDASLQTASGVMSAITAWQNNVNSCCDAINTTEVPSILNGTDDGISRALISSATTTLTSAISASASVNQQESVYLQQDTNATSQWSTLVGTLNNAIFTIFSALHIQ